MWWQKLTQLIWFLGKMTPTDAVTSNSVRPHRGQPTRLRRPWDSPGKNTGAGCYFLLQWIKVKSESEVTPWTAWTSWTATPWTAAYQAPPSMGFSRQEYWSGCHRLLQTPTARFRITGSSQEERLGESRGCNGCDNSERQQCNHL